MNPKISTAVALALVVFLAAPSFAASKRSQSAQRGPYTPDIITQPTGKSTDFQGGGGQFYRGSKTKKHGGHSQANN